MKYLFQRPRDDELITSALVRTCRRASLPINALTKLLTDGRKFMPGFFQVSHLECLADFASCPPADLLWHHSVFPYATAYFSEKLMQRCWTSAHATGKGAAGIAATMQNVSNHSKWRRFCPMCVDEDHRTWGESHWRRAHNLPGVVVCTKHRCKLKGTHLSATGPGSWSYALPHEVLARRLLVFEPGPFDFELADISLGLLNRPRLAGRERSSDWYRNRLMETGLLTPGRDVNPVKLVDWGRSASQVYAVRYGFTPRDAKLHWMTLMVRPRMAVPFSPLKHAFFEAALSMPVEASDLGLLDHVPTSLLPRPTAARDATFASRLRRILRRNLQEGKRIRICDALTEAGCWTEYRHNRAGFPHVAAVVEDLKRSSASVRPAGLSKK
jgi:hypothetical protein